MNSLKLKIAFLAFSFTAPYLDARLCDTREEIENRYGPPIAQDHPMMENVDIAELSKWPEDKGWQAHRKMLLELSEFSKSLQLGDKSARMMLLSSFAEKSEKTTFMVVHFYGMLDKQKRFEDLQKRYSRMQQVCVYLNKDTLVQVAYIQDSNGINYSISESYFKLTKESLQSSNNSSSDKFEYSIEPIDKEFYDQLCQLNTERELIPPGLTDVIKPASSEYNDLVKDVIGVATKTQIPINTIYDDSTARIWINFTGKIPARLLPGDPEEKQTEQILDQLYQGMDYDPLGGEGKIGAGFNFYSYQEFGDILHSSREEGLAKAGKAAGIKSDF